MWWSPLIPAAIERAGRRFPPLELLRELLGEAGLRVEAEWVQLDGLVFGERYLDPRGPLEPAWRAGDSTWSLATPGELGAALERLERLLAAGEVGAFLAERERRRRSVGQTTFLWARAAGPESH